jgi:hypothetical protein
MKKRAALFVLILSSASWLICPSLGRVSENSEPKDSVEVPPAFTSPASGRKAKWTVMVYMNADNDLDASAIADFREMAKVAYSSEVKVAVQLDRLNTNDSDTEWGETRRFLMRKNLTPTRSAAWKGFDTEQNMGDLKTLVEFTTWAKKEFPAERYMLVIWNHGDGWRLNEMSPGLRRRQRFIAQAQSSLPKLKTGAIELPSGPLEEKTLEPHYRTISEDVTNQDRLYVREVQDALESVFKDGESLELLGFDACLMQMLEVGYAMRRVTKVMVASEELEPNTGWNYSGWLQRLVEKPEVNGKLVGELLINSYASTYGRSQPDTTLSATDLTKMETLAAAVSAFGDELAANLDNSWRHIAKARHGCNIYGRRYHGIDLHRFASMIAKGPLAPSLRERAATVVKLTEAVVTNNYVGQARRGRFGSRGLALYFPANRKAYEGDKFKDAYKDENDYYPVQFVKDHRWDNFLHAFFRYV